MTDHNELPVTGEDREAAAAFYGSHLARPGEVLVTAHMRAGKIDESPLIQAFARHRLNTRATPALSVDREDFLWPSLEVFAAQSESERASTLAAYYAHRGLSLPASPASPLSDATRRMEKTLGVNFVRKPASQGDEGAREETWASINQWCDDTFGTATVSQIVSRAKEEWCELGDAVEVGDTPAAAIEAADVVICLCRIPGFADALQAKMAINRKRKWRLVGNGTGYHIPEGAALSPETATTGGE